jgi:hypothetical protein
MFIWFPKEDTYSPLEFRDYKGYQIGFVLYKQSIYAQGQSLCRYLQQDIELYLTRNTDYERTPNGTILYRSLDRRGGFLYSDIFVSKQGMDTLGEAFPQQYELIDWFYENAVHLIEDLNKIITENDLTL